MTYNNTVWDNIQSKFVSYIKTIVVGGIALFYMISGIVNISRQYKTIKAAEEINQSLEVKIASLEVEKNKLRRKSEYASSSAYRERQSRNLLGKGREDDYWLITDNLDDDKGVGREFFEDQKRRIIEEWWALFTK